MSVLELVRTRHDRRAAVVIDETPPAELVAALFAHDLVVVWPAAPTLDLRGEICPFTFVRTKLQLETLAAGARLRVVVDHEPAAKNVPRSAVEWGQTILSVTPLPSQPPSWEIWIEKRTTTERTSS